MDDATILRAAQQYMGKTAWPTVLWTMLVLIAYGVVLRAGLLHQMPIIASFAALTWLLYALYTPLHEAVHSNIIGKKSGLNFINEAIGYIAGSVLAMPFTVHRSAHMAHHRATNVVGEDPDAVFRHNGFWHVVSHSVVLISNEYRDYFAGAFSRATPRTRLIVRAELAVMLGWRLALALAGFPVEMLVLGLLANIAGLVLVGTFFAWAVHTPFDKTERYQTTSTILLPRWIHRPVTWLWLWQNYHSIHHLFPRIPFYHYRDLFDEIRPGMEARGAPIIDFGARVSGAD